MAYKHHRSHKTLTQPGATPMAPATTACQRCGASTRHPQAQKRCPGQPIPNLPKPPSTQAVTLTPQQEASLMAAIQADREKKAAYNPADIDLVVNGEVVQPLAEEAKTPAAPAGAGQA